MYSDNITNKVNKMFEELNEKAAIIVRESSKASEAANKVTKAVSSELTIRSKTILSDMLYDLSVNLMNTEFFSDISRQNKFYAMNIKQEILSKYQFLPSATVDYKEASRTIEALKVGGTVLVTGGVLEVGTVLVKGLSLSSLKPIPIGVLLVATLGAALADYIAVSPKHSRKQMMNAIENYLAQTKKQFLDWFDEVENYFNMRVEEIKKTI
jgi:hypothetical protein